MSRWSRDFCFPVTIWEQDVLVPKQLMVRWLVVVINQVKTLNVIAFVMIKMVGGHTEVWHVTIGQMCRDKKVTWSSAHFLKRVLQSIMTKKPILVDLTKDDDDTALVVKEMTPEEAMSRYKKLPKDAAELFAYLMGIDDHFIVIPESTPPSIREALAREAKKFNRIAQVLDRERNRFCDLLISIDWAQSQKR